MSQVLARKYYLKYYIPSICVTLDTEEANSFNGILNNTRLSILIMVDHVILKSLCYFVQIVVDSEIYHFSIEILELSKT